MKRKLSLWMAVIMAFAMLPMFPQYAAGNIYGSGSFIARVESGFYQGQVKKGNSFEWDSQQKFIHDWKVAIDLSQHRSTNTTPSSLDLLITVSGGTLAGYAREKDLYWLDWPTDTDPRCLDAASYGKKTTGAILKANGFERSYGSFSYDFTALSATQGRLRIYDSNVNLSDTNADRLYALVEGLYIVPDNTDAASVQLTSGSAVSDLTRQNPSTTSVQNDNNVSSSVANQINAKKKTIHVSIPANKDNVTIGAANLRSIMQADADLYVTTTTGELGITLSTKAMKDAGITERSLNVKIAEIDVDNPDDYILEAIGSLASSVDLLVAADFEITQNGKKITEFKTPVSLSMSVAPFKVPEDRLSNLTGVRFIPDATLNLFDGSYNSVSREFSYPTNSLSIHGMMLLGENTAPQVVVQQPVIDDSTLFTPPTQIPQQLTLVIGSLNFTHNGVVKTLHVAPEIIDNSTMVPLRFIAEAFGADVSWDGDNDTAVILLDGRVLRVTVGVMQEGMNTPAINKNGSVLVPLRYVGEAFGAVFDFDGTTGTVFITK